MPPTIIFVPGFWEGSAPFARAISLLQERGYSTHIAVPPSTGTVSPGNPSMHDEIAAIRSEIKDVVEEGEEIVLVLHSAGGFLGSGAIEGLALKARREKGLQGGVKNIVFLTGGVLPEGFEHDRLPILEIDGGALNCLTPEKILFNDLDEESAKTWIQKLQPQPAHGWDMTSPYCGWREVPSVYLLCENDACIPLAIQMQMAELAGGKVERCEAGHMCIISMPERVVEVVEIVVEAAEEG